MLLSAVVSMAAGALLLGQTVLTGFLAGRFPIVLIGGAVVVVGAVRLWHGRYGARSWRSTLIGTTYVVLGLIVIGKPLVAQELIMLLLSAWAVVAGLLALFTSFSLRRSQKPARTG
ncbi:MAG: hypothetical protein F4Y80_16880 [Caldilineaceae bacterium SB0665_bin_21]|nr:hypothetical protein [Caldilineaceae bacterium SB0665_bin_21]MYA06271.1 hypothetical protein [Caldilineaceae bacterium SB0664_bin_22]MYC64380.1 hypothetical protein [Caldilineaceae bacterium SB0661_bin_34]